MLRAYVDESGDRGTSPTATDFFVMSAVVVDDASRAAIQGRLAAIRNHLNKPPGTVLHFARNIKDHGGRVYVCRELATVPGVTITNVILCKRYLTPGALMAADPQAVLSLHASIHSGATELDRARPRRGDHRHVRPRQELPVSTAAPLPRDPKRDAHEHRVALDSGRPDQSAE
jgi:hypothetical protein